MDKVVAINWIKMKQVTTKDIRMAGETIQDKYLLGALEPNSQCAQLPVKKLFSLCVNTLIVSDGQRRFAGKLFHVTGPHTSKFLCPELFCVK